PSESAGVARRTGVAGSSVELGSSVTGHLVRAARERLRTCVRSRGSTRPLAAVHHSGMDMTAKADVELVVDARARLGEGPVWDDETGELVWVDILEGIVHRTSPATGRDVTFEVGRTVGS